MNIRLKGKAFITYLAINAKDIIMEGRYTPDIIVSYQRRDWETTITKVTFNNQYAVSIGDILTVEMASQKYKYQINHINEINKTKFILSTHTRNHSSIFATPCVFNNKAEIGWTVYAPNELYANMDSCAYINTYIGRDLEPIGEYLYLEYLYRDSPTFKQLEERLMKHPQFVSIIENGQYTIYQFKVPIQFKQDIELFNEGKFSLMSQDLKEKIIKFSGSNKAISDLSLIKRGEFVKVTTPLVQVLYKLPQLRESMEKQLNCSIGDSELLSKPKIENEIIII